ncbi:MAG: peptide deformylase [Elusimicrobia bacterium]|nr:peptide deformylase [Elusimicrobiota bacterium]MDE2236774.1 peptide deformylase [Elusimicrobiota bacterium]MDE2426368.1 peptide deformylase [Elusimicrobiota bacterium]
MSIRRIVKHGEAALKRHSAPVDYEAMRGELPALLRDMWKTMYAARGVGLAAPQIGLNLRLAVIDVKPEGRSRRLVLINPEIVKLEGELREEEGCLSVPGVYAKVQRAARATIRALDQKGRPYELSGEGLLARAFQHEIDHLDGKLFIDRLAFEHKLRVLAVVRELKPTWA